MTRPHGRGKVSGRAETAVRIDEDAGAENLNWDEDGNAAVGPRQMNEELKSATPRVARTPMRCDVRIFLIGGLLAQAVYIGLTLLGGGESVSDTVIRVAGAALVAVLLFMIYWHIRRGPPQEWSPWLMLLIGIASTSNAIVEGVQDLAHAAAPCARAVYGLAAFTSLLCAWFGSRRGARMSGKVDPV